MPYVVHTSGFHEHVIEWLQENVGDLLWSRPIIEWKGRGWTMNSLGQLITKNSNGKSRYVIRIDDKELAVLCALRWT